MAIGAWVQRTEKGVRRREKRVRRTEKGVRRTEKRVRRTEKGVRRTEKWVRRTEIVLWGHCTTLYHRYSIFGEGYIHREVPTLKTVLLHTTRLLGLGGFLGGIILPYFSYIGDHLDTKHSQPIFLLALLTGLKL